MRMLTNNDIKSKFKGESIEDIKNNMLEAKALSRSLPIKGVLPIEWIENQLKDAYDHIKFMVSITKEIITEDDIKSTMLSTMKSIMTRIMDSNYDSIIVYSVCEAYLIANANSKWDDLIIPPYEECLKSYTSIILCYKD